MKPIKIYKIGIVLFLIGSILVFAVIFNIRWAITVVHDRYLYDIVAILAILMLYSGLIIILSYRDYSGHDRRP